MRRATACQAVIAILLGASVAQGQAEPEPSDIQIHGFVSQGYIKTTRNNYLAETGRKQGSFDFTEVGINFTKSLSDKLRVGIQLFTHDLGPLGNYSPQFDWYYLDYRLFDWLGIRAGKTKLPWGLYNESNDIDAGRVQVLLPQSLYPVANRESLFAQTGGELYGDVPLGGAGSLEYRLYGGTIFLNIPDVSAQLKGFDVAYDVGGRVMYRPPIEGLQLGTSLQAVRFDFQFTPTADQLADLQSKGQIPTDYNGIIDIALPAKLWVASAEYQIERLALAAEFGRTYLDYETNLVGPKIKSIRQGAYVMGSYQVKPWFTPGLYYSAYFPDVDHIKKRSTYQHDVAATLRFDVTPNWLVKAEGHFMHGTAGLKTDLNGRQKLDSLTKNWGVFLLKTTAYF
jgi:hypothetical protein